MGTTTQKLAEITYITDFDVSGYRAGEIQGAFQEKELKNYIKYYGHQELSAQLGFMQFQIWKTLREINGEASNENCKEVNKDRFTL